MSVSSFTQKNQLLYSFKKLLGLGHTSARKEFFNESVPSYIQGSSQLIMAGNIRTFPMGLPTNYADLDVYPMDNNFMTRSVLNSPYQIVDFELEQDPTSTYSVSSVPASITADGDTVSSSTVRAYFLKLPNNYTSASMSSYDHPKRGIGAFQSGQALCESEGQLQLIPPSANPLCKATVYSSSYQVINSGDDENYLLDYSNGVLFVQDQGFSSSRVPARVRAILFIGDYLETHIENIQEELFSSSLFRRKPLEDNVVVFNNTLSPPLNLLEVPNLLVTSELRVMGSTVIVNITQENLLIRNNKLVLNSDRSVNQGFSALCFRENSNDSLSVLYHDDSDNELKFSINTSAGSALPNSITDLNAYPLKFYIPKYEIDSFDTTTKQEHIIQLRQNPEKGYVIERADVRIRKIGSVIELVPAGSTTDTFNIGSLSSFVSRIFATLNSVSYSSGVLPLVTINDNELVRMTFATTEVNQVLMTRETGIEPSSVIDGGSF